MVTNGGICGMVGGEIGGWYFVVLCDILSGGGDMRKFWSVKGVFTTYSVVVMGMLVGVTVVLALTLNRYAGPTLRLFSFTYIPGLLVGVMFGPVAGMTFGVAADFVTWAVAPNGPYFPGFAVSAALTNVLYAAAFYRPGGGGMTKGRIVLAALMAQLAVLLLVNLGLNAIWLQAMYGMTAGELFAGARVALKFAQYPVDVAVVCGCVRLVGRLRARSG